MKEGTGSQSQHYAGTAFDVAQTYSTARRNALRNSAVNSGIWTYVEPASISPTWVHFDRRFGNPACRTGGYPTIRQGSRGNYVCIAQDDLNTLGFRTRRFRWSIWNANRYSGKKLPTIKRSSS